MDFFLIALGLTLLFLIINIRNTLRERFSILEEEINGLRQQLAKRSAAQAPEKPAVPAQPAPVVAPVIITPEPPEVPKEKSLSSELENLLKNADREVLKEEEAVREKSAAIAETEATAQTSPQPVIPDPIKKPGIAAAAPPPPPPPPSPSFLERNPDLEKFIGENLISKIGIGILVLAIGYFVKFAIDNDWIGNVGRVGIGILCGAILVFLGHRVRKSYQAFSSVLIGGGFAIFYFTITLAFHQFQIFSQTTTFIIMVVITAFAVALSHINDRQELAIIALIGGFATPFMASNGSGNYNALFIYLIILNSGLLAIAYSKSWRLLNILAFLFTVVLFGGWLYSLDYASGRLAAPRGLIYASIFYLMFMLINIAYNIRQNKAFISSDFGILLANTCLYFSAGLYLLTLMEAAEYRGLFTIIIAVLNLLASYILFRNKKVDKNILYLLIGITLSFISLTAPIQLNAHNITLFWAAEAVLLFWLYQKSSIQLVRLASILVWFAMLISLSMDLEQVYSLVNPKLLIIVNRGFITAICAAISCFLLYRLAIKKDQPVTAIYPALPGTAYSITGIVILYLAGMLEIDRQFIVAFPGTGLYELYLLLFTYSFAFIVFILSGKKAGETAAGRYARVGLLAIGGVIYLFSTSQLFEIQRNLIYLQKHLAHFGAHWLAAIIVAGIIYYLIRTIRRNASDFEQSFILVTWLICTFIVVYVSVEAHLLINLLYYSAENSLEKIQRVYIKTGLPILWGLCSFGFMWLGMKHKFRTLRIVSLTLFSLILLKLFTYDIRNIPVAGKIAAFFSLGVLLLVISFMYQRLKKIIVEDESKPVV